MRIQMWENIHPKIREVSEEIANTHKYDTAILEAFKYVEAEIQEHISSKNIGLTLINEAFDGTPPKINISNDIRNNEGIKNLFLGALGLIRNDRAHKKVPLFPCVSMEICLYYISFASFLLYLLSKDKNKFPQIISLRVLGTIEHPRVELRGENFTPDIKVIADGIELTTLKNSLTEIEAVLPIEFNGTIKVVIGENESNSLNCDVQVLDDTSENVYEIIRTEIPLYKDELCTQLYEKVVGILMRSMEGGLNFQRISPVEPGKYQAGIYINYGPFKNSSVEEAWYRNPVTGDIEYAWLGSLIMAPEILGKVSAFKTIGISIKPKRIQTQPNEKRSLRVIARMKDGNVRMEKDVTESITEWKSSDNATAFIKDGILIPKKLGKAKIECQYEKFLASVDVSVENYVKGDVVTYFEGIKNIQQIAVDTDGNLYLCNQSPSVYKISRQGEVREVARVPFEETNVICIDSIAVDKHHNLYVNNITDRQCLKFEWNGSSYSSPRKIALSIEGTPKGIAFDKKDNVFVAVMLNQVVMIKPDGKESSFSTRDTAIHIALDSQGYIYIPSARNSSIDVYTKDGNLVNSIIHGVRETPVGIIIDEKDAIYLMFHESGRIIKIINSSLILKPEEVAVVGSYPRGMVMDSNNRIFVSFADKGDIKVIY